MPLTITAQKLDSDIWHTKIQLNIQNALKSDGIACLYLQINSDSTFRQLFLEGKFPPNLHIFRECNDNAFSFIIRILCYYHFNAFQWQKLEQKLFLLVTKEKKEGGKRGKKKICFYHNPRVVTMAYLLKTFHDMGVLYSSYSNCIMQSQSDMQTKWQ